MLLGQKKIQGDEKNWSIILNPLRSELDKKRVAQKISAAFSLSQDEASDLVSNTPIILLDNLTRDDAVRVKHYFQSSGAEIMLTNDIFHKRKCYRTVWPDPPSLSFLEDWKEVKAGREEAPAEELAVEEALQEIQSLSMNAADKMPVREERESFSSSSQEERERLIRDADRWKRESTSYQAEVVRLRQELDHMRRELDKIQKERAFFEQTKTSQDELARKREKETHDFQALLNNAEEKYEGLKEEYRQARVLLEEKLGQANRKIEGFEKLRHDLELSLRQQTEKYQALEKEYHNVHALLERKLSGLNEEVTSWKNKADEMTEQIQSFETHRKILEQGLKDQSEQANSWRSKYQSFVQEAENAKAAFQEEKSQRLKIEEHLKDLEKKISRWTQDLELKNREARQWELRALDLEKELNESRHAYQEQERLFEGKNKLFESKERELESLRRQVREVNHQIEQREAVQKRMQLMSQLADKESRLKKLVTDQEKIEAEIRGREESMRAILMEQESLEKEIIEAKQTERHLMEQINKKDKPSKFRILNGKTEGTVFQPAGDGEIAD
ncbi:MAG: hypothetical protein HYZ83_02650 [Candidatus Omnitrophica bacterium]|nr:hypothetical protein [Candidatus Omnitrophota bacterium]